ncbi:DUF881 domain-containing protein [Luteimicrobium subarcticum]|uniref:Uncharacterized protein YlxW (UPF0749 family) n=1 Tax=Luteimicrobium subarcticum TaxID=620910 RepID=A0A2M8WJJ3_9MICO|nr:DUF881 domain-containing protein [Luteimicrobium subarcticum]PJI91056.1 uncharacterized protein YlxW (UPF0749 family) [Luteimicrobium subarcticum]
MIRRRPRVRAAVSVALVLALAGLLFTASAELARGTQARHPQDLSQLVQAESDEVGRLQGQVDDLQGQVDTLSQAGSASIPTGDPKVMAPADVEAGLVPVTGGGLTVALSDAPQTGNYPPGITVDDLVVHQQDMQAVINALWAGGAEAMMLEDQRVTATTAFRCVGNVLSLGGRLYSPPFTVTAIGDPAAMRGALDASPQIAIYKQYVDAVDLGWKVTDKKSLDMPAASAATLEHATVPSGTDVFGSD